MFHDDGLRFFCHAGVDPTLPLDAQKEAVLVWSRFDFPGSIELDRYVVHGHTVIGSVPKVRRNRINLDTGAWKSGILSGAIFESGRPNPVAMLVGSALVDLTRAFDPAEGSAAP